MKWLELEDELSENSEKTEEGVLASRTRHWVESVGHNQPDSVSVPKQEQHFVDSSSTNVFCVSKFHGHIKIADVNNGLAASCDHGLYFSNHMEEQRHSMSNLLQLHLSLRSVKNSVSLQQFIQPVCKNLLQQTVLSSYPLLGNPNTGSIVPVTSDYYFPPTTAAKTPSDLVPFQHQLTVPNSASTAVNQFSLKSKRQDQ